MISVWFCQEVGYFEKKSLVMQQQPEPDAQAIDGESRMRFATADDFSFCCRSALDLVEFLLVDAL
jgi:hypothetical protein